MIEPFLQGNRRFVEGEFVARREQYESLAKEQTPTLLWIGCADSRVSETAVTDSQPGQIFVHRNVANIVAFNDNNVAAVLEYGVYHLNIADVVVCGHYGCGGVQALDSQIDDPAIQDWLLMASQATAAVDALGPLEPETRHRRLVEENVRVQVGHLERLGLIRRARASFDRPRLHGWVYDLATGELNVVVDGRG